MDETLKACPFCGGDKIAVVARHMGDCLWMEGAAWCEDCGAEVETEADRKKHPDDLKAEAIAAWNRRTPDADAMRRALEALVAKIDVVQADPSYQGVWSIAHIHGVPYTGPNWADELEAARAALSTTKGEG